MSNENDNYMYDQFNVTSPTFSINIDLVSPPNVIVGAMHKFITKNIFISHSDEGLEHNKTSEMFSRFLKNNFINETSSRLGSASPDKDLFESYWSIGERYRNVDELESLHKMVLVDEWIGRNRPFTGIIVPPILGLEESGKPKSELEKILEEISTKYKISDWYETKEMLIKLSQKKTGFSQRVLAIVEESNQFLINKKISAKGIVSTEVDKEDEENKNIKITFSIPNLKIDESIELAQELITYLAGLDKDALENIRIQVKPA